MRSVDLFRRFLLIILPSYQQASMVGVLSTAALMSALLPVLHQSGMEHVESLIMSMKILFPHHFREYHSRLAGSIPGDLYTLGSLHIDHLTLLECARPAASGNARCTSSLSFTILINDMHQGS